MGDLDVSKYLDASSQLMEQFKSLAPGSQKHCLNVSVLCESVAKDLGLKSPDILKCAALFHDIGKMINPEYFIENQNGTNIHDTINDPIISYQLITRHVSDTVMILHQHKFPLEVINIVLEHHGDSVTRYFYNIALKNNGHGLHPTELVKKFRYKCPKPQTTESAILMICDIIEAEARSKFTGSKSIEQDNVDALIESRIKELIEDGQLDNLKIGVLKKIKIVLSKELQAMYHTRIKYDDEEDKTVGDLKGNE